MKTILFANELGSGLNHLNQLIAVAQRLRGNRLVFVLRDAPMVSPIVAKALGDDFTCIRGPQWAPLRTEARSVYTETFADVMLLFGFGETDRVQAAVKQWRALLDDIRPDAIVADFAPSLRLAAAPRYPVLVIGNGYSVPPVSRPMPPIRPWVSIVPPKSRAAEARILESLNECQHQVSGPALDFVSDLFSGTKTVSCSLQDFDPYNRHRSLGSRWPINVPSFGSSLVSGTKRPGSIFVYLPGSHPLLKSVLAAVNGAKRPTSIYVTGIDPVRLAASCGSHIAVFKKPADLEKVLPRAELLIHHGGLAMAHAGLATGLPQLVLPDNLERALNSRVIASLGTGMVVPTRPVPEPSEIGKQIEILSQDQKYRTNALKLKSRLALAKQDTMDEIWQLCSGLMNAEVPAAFAISGQT